MNKAAGAAESSCFDGRPVFVAAPDNIDPGWIQHVVQQCSVSLTDVWNIASADCFAQQPGSHAHAVVPIPCDYCTAGPLPCDYCTAGPLDMQKKALREQS